MLIPLVAGAVGFAPAVLAKAKFVDTNVVVPRPYITRRHLSSLEERSHIVKRHYGVWQ